jgi:hypothetical protein
MPQQQHDAKQRASDAVQQQQPPPPTGRRERSHQPAQPVQRKQSAAQRPRLADEASRDLYHQRRQPARKSVVDPVPLDEFGLRKCQLGKRPRERIEEQ